MDIIEDNGFFKRIGFIKKSSFVLDVSIESFRGCFNDNVSDDVTFFGMSGHKKHFHGRIRTRSFDLHRPTSLNKTGMAAAKGTYEERGTRLAVHIFTYIPLTTFLLVYSMLLLIIIIFTGLTIASGRVPLIVIIVFSLGFVYFGLMTYFQFKKEVSLLNRDIEREVGYWMAKMSGMQQGL